MSERLELRPLSITVATGARALNGGRPLMIDGASLAYDRAIADLATIGSFDLDVCRLRVAVVEIFAEAARAAQPRRLRRRFPLFYLESWRLAIAQARRCKFCGGRVRRCGVRGPLPVHCSPACAKRGYDFSPRKRETRRAWAKANRARQRADRGTA